MLAISSGLRSELDGLHLIAYLEEQRRFTAPVYPGDTISARYRVESVRRSKSRPGAGVVTMAIEVANQDGEIVQTGTDVLLVGARTTEAEAA